jgi:hypothetical protein
MGKKVGVGHCNCSGSCSDHVIRFTIRPEPSTRKSAPSCRASPQRSRSRKLTMSCNRCFRPSQSMPYLLSHACSSLRRQHRLLRTCCPAQFSRPLCTSWRGGLAVAGCRPSGGKREEALCDLPVFWTQVRVQKLMGGPMPDSVFLRPNLCNCDRMLCLQHGANGGGNFLTWCAGVRCLAQGVSLFPSVATFMQVLQPLQYFCFFLRM